MEQRAMKPTVTSKVKKIVYIDETSLLDKSDIKEQETIEWLTKYFDVYIVQADDEFIHLLRGDYLISPILYDPMFHGESLCFQVMDEKSHERPQMDWQRIKDYFSDIVEKGENMGDADYDETLLAMLRS
jgi:5'(3')-deoxyribonucleotidase